MIVLDASVLIELLLHSDIGEELAEVVLESGETLHAPNLVDVEVAHVFRRYVRRGELPEGRAEQALSDLTLAPLFRYEHTELIARVWELRSSLTAYDATYVALAEARQAPLLTMDGKLARAHGHDARVELIVH